MPGYRFTVVRRWWRSSTTCVSSLYSPQSPLSFLSLPAILTGRMQIHSQSPRGGVAVDRGLLPPVLPHAALVSLTLFTATVVPNRSRAMVL